MMTLPTPTDRSVVIAKGIIGAGLLVYGVRTATGATRPLAIIVGAAVAWVALADVAEAFRRTPLAGPQGGG